jgi:uncharacterized MAPEG superfamily protein
MEFLIICLLIATMLPILAKAPVAIAQSKMGGYDNRNPRAQQNRLEGFGARALAGHLNAFESLIMFAPSLCVAIALNQTGETIQVLAAIHIAARFAYHILYLANIDKLRSLVWGIAAMCPLIILTLCVG